MDQYQVIHSSPELKTVAEYCNQTDSPAFKYVGKETEFLSIKGEDELTNLDRILTSYTTQKEKQDNPASKQGELLLKVGTKFFIPIENIERIGLLTEGIEVTSNDVNAFKAAKLAELECDEGYKKVYKSIANQKGQGTFKDEYPDATVWLWCRALSDTFSVGSDAELKGEIFDITPFVESLSTSNTKNGGNFKITLPPLVCELKTETDTSGRISSRYIIKKNSTKVYNTDSVNGKDTAYVAEGQMFGEELDKRNSFLFHTIINENDLIFIRFETLNIEQEQRMKDSKNFYIDKANLAGRIYDMIGLVDNNTENVRAETNEIVTEIGGRDLIKLFIDDGTYFYALENAQGQLKLAGGSTADNDLLQRVFSDGSLYYLSLYFNTSIEHTLKFIMQQLSNIKIVPTSLFTSYGDRVNKTFSPKPIGVGELGGDIDYKGSYSMASDLQSRKAKGIWQIVKLIIDESVSKRRIIDASMSTANGSLLNFIRKACQEPFVEFYTDTYGDEFYLIVRKPPYDKKGVTTLLEGNVSTEEGAPSSRPLVIDIDSSDVISDSLSFDGDNTYSWYHFTPQNVFFGESSAYSLTLTPAIYFKEYAELWGSKPLDVVHNYAPYYPSSKDECGDMSYYQEQTIYDLKYLVESHSYLPFTRKGTITLNGDRRLKRGNLIRFKPTGEIFFIDSVSQKLSISDSAVDRQTTIEVSRGMVEDFIHGVDIDGLTNVSYFNIVNTELTIEKKTYQEGKKSYTALNSEILFSKFQVNKDIFNFFLKRQQFLAKDYTKTNKV